MTASPIETTEVLDLSDHEFEVPCEITTTTGSVTRPCAAVAEWFVEHERHCPPGELTNRLFCGVHHAYMAAGGLFHCLKCDKNHELHVTRAERLKP